MPWHVVELATTVPAGLRRLCENLERATRYRLANYLAVTSSMVYPVDDISRSDYLRYSA